MRRLLAVALLASACGGSSVGSIAPTATATWWAALASVFGGPYEQLPGDLRVEVSSRLNAVLPADFDKRTDAEQSAWFFERLQDGLVRLDDSTLVRRFRLEVAGFGHLPVPVCAAAVRATDDIIGADEIGVRFGSGAKLSQATRDAFLTALSDDQRKDWVEIMVEAIEASAHGRPGSRTVGYEGITIIRGSGRLATPEENSAIRAWTDGSSPSDAIECGGFRAFQAVLLRLPASDLATYSLFHVQP